MNIVHQLPGRLRVELPEIYRNPDLASRLTNELSRQDGVIRVEANHLTTRILVKYAPDRLTSDKISSYLSKSLDRWQNRYESARRTGKLPQSPGQKFSLPSPAISIPVQHHQDDEVYELERLPIARQAIFTGLAATLLLYAAATHDSRIKFKGTKALHHFNTVMGILSGYPIFRTATEHLWKKGQLSTELLASIGSLTSMAIEESRLGLFINFLIYLSTLLRTMAAEHARDKIRTLLAGRKTVARIHTPQGLIRIPADQVVPGTTVIVKKGERVPVDGTVCRGTALMDEFIVKVHHTPTRVSTGDRIYAGSLVSAGTINFHAEKTRDQSYIGRILSMLQSCTRRSPLMDERVSGVMNRISLVALTAAAGIYLTTRDTRRAVAMLIVGAPGAAGLASSLAFGTAAGQAACNGLLVKDDRHIERTGRADTVLFNQLDFLLPQKNHDQETIAMLREAQVTSIGLLSSKSKEAVAAAARRLGLANFWSNCRPPEKERLVRRLRQQGHTVAVVGDAAGDVLALSAADVGLTPARGDELNLESANIIIVGQDPRQVAWLKLLANQSIRIARQNTVLSLGSNILGLSLGILNLLTPLNMAILQNISTIGIFLNSGRLLWPLRSDLARRKIAAEAAFTWEPPNGVYPVLKTKTDPRRSLDVSEAAIRLAHSGPNILPSQPLPTVTDIFRQQLENYMSKVLVGIAGISLLLGKQSNALMSTGVLLVNTAMAVIQERRTLSSLQMLDNLVPPKARVIRSGRAAVVEARGLVPGDMIIVEAGDKVPADARLLEVRQLVVEEASLTGESVPVLKKSGVSGRTGYLYMGTGVLSGRALAQVVHTGANTEIGRIAGSINAKTSFRTPLHDRLDEVGLTLVRGGAAVCGASILAGLWHRETFGNIVNNATNLAISVIPDGLAPMITLTTALGGLSLLKRQVAVRQLPAIDTLGCASVICCDKTGTLTKNRMEVEEIFCGGKDWVNFSKGFHGAVESLEYFFRIACLCNNASIKKHPNIIQTKKTHSQNGGYTIEGDSMEGALLIAAEQAGFPVMELVQNYQRLSEIPFNSEAMYMAVTARNGQGQVWSLVKGAPDAILSKCSSVIHNGRVQAITESDRNTILAKVRELSNRALRILAFASKPLTGEESPIEGLIFAGVAGILDPPRPEVKFFLAGCRQAGIKVVMITGDHPATALAVAKDIGIVHTEARALTGKELDKMSDSDLTKAVSNVQVFARTSPRHKLRLIKALKDKGQVVAMVGDGVNDVPALKEAHLGVSMGITGTAVAREVAAVTLTDDNIAQLTEAIKAGRTVYTNIRQTMRYLLTTNLGDGIIILVAALFGRPMPLTPLQLLWVNLSGDPLISWGLANNPPVPDIMNRPPRKFNESIFSQGLGRMIISRSLAMGLSALMVYHGSLAREESLALTQTKSMAALALGRIFHLWDYRPKGPRANPRPGNPSFSRKVNFRSNVMAGGGLLTLTALAGAMYLPFLRPFLQTVPLRPAHWLPVIGWSSIGILTDQVLNSPFKHCENNLS